MTLLDVWVQPAYERVGQEVRGPAGAWWIPVPAEAWPVPQGADPESPGAPGLPRAPVRRCPLARQTCSPPLGGYARGAGPDQPAADPLHASQGAAHRGVRQSP